MRMELRRLFNSKRRICCPISQNAQVPALHGHSFQAEIVVAGECDPRLAWLMDYAEINRAFQPLWEQLDHHYLNEVPGLENPTSENVAAWIWQRLKPRFAPRGSGRRETCTARCVYRG